jgi:hypothetical protein
MSAGRERVPAFIPLDPPDDPGSAHSADGRLLIGWATGFSGDRVDAAGPVVYTVIARGGPVFLIFETLAECTLALAQLARRQNPDAGYEPHSSRRCGGPVLARCLRHGLRIVSNFGAANPRGAARKIRALAQALRVNWRHA